MTLSRVYGTIASIISEREKVAELKHETFVGVRKDEFIRDLTRILDDDVYVKRDPATHFSNRDVNAVASSRFFQGAGMTLLIGWLAVVAVTLSLTVYFPIVPIWANYVLNGFYAIVFVRVYTVKLKKLKKELWAGLGKPDGANE